jgi:hypothetical protein
MLPAVIPSAGLPTCSEKVAAMEVTCCVVLAARLMAFCAVSRGDPLVPVVPPEPVEHPAIKPRAPATAATAAVRRRPIPVLWGEYVESRAMAAG